MATFEILGEPLPGACFELSDVPMVIGRDAFCEIAIEVRGVSRRHACISKVGDDYFVEDLNSLNGTFVNGERITGPTRLADKDELMVHVVGCRFRNLALAKPVSSPPQTSSMTNPAAFQPTPPPRTPQRRVQHLQPKPREQTSKEASQKLEAVLSVTRTLGSSLQLEKVLSGVLDGVFSVFTQASRGHVLFVDSSGSAPTIRATKQGGTDTICDSESGTADFEIVRDAIETGQAVLCVDEVDEAHRDTVLDFPLRSMMCVPLIGPRRKLIGLLYLDADDSDNPFSEDDLEVLIGIAGIAGRIIDYSLEHGRMLQQAKELASEREGREQAEGQIQSAQHIQRSLYRTNAPELAGFDLSGSVFPAEQTCGDYFDFIEQNDGSLMVVVADVSGHGLGPALYAIQTRAYIRAVCRTTSNVAEILEETNRLLTNERDDGNHSFVTMFLANLNPKNRELSYAGAGHNGHLLRASGEWEELPSTGLALRLIKEFQTESHTLSLQSGDLLLLVTDGFAEAFSTERELFGVSRLLEFVKQNRDLNAHSLINAIHEKIVDFQGQERLSDDMTAVVIKYVAEG